MAETTEVRDTDAVHIMLNDPRLTKLSELDRGLTASRRKIANEILFLLNSERSKSARQHTLIVGPVGSGKSHIMRYLQTIVREYHESTAAIVIQEETRSILSLFDFVVTCLRHFEAVTSDQLVEMLKSEDPKPIDAVIGLFDAHTKDRRTAIFIEDFSDLFRNMSNDDRNAMQTFFNERKNITVVASSMSLIVEKQTTLGTLSNLFSVRRLPELSEDETSMFLGRMLMNQKHLPPLEMAAIRVLHHLAGGNQQVMKEAGKLLNAREWPDLVTVLPELMEKVFIPYYDKRLALLDKNQWAVLKAIAERNGEALSEERLSKLSNVTGEELTNTLEELRLSLYINQIRVGNVMYFDIHEPFIRILMERTERTQDDFNALLLLTTHWFEVERRAADEWRDRPPIDVDLLSIAIAHANTANHDTAVRGFETILAIDPVHPQAVVHAFNSKLVRSQRDALDFLRSVITREGSKLADTLEVVRLINDIVRPDLELRAALLKLYAEPNSLLLQSIIHEFIEKKDEGEGYIENTLEPLLSELGQESPVFNMLHDLVKRYNKRDSIWEQSLLHIPVELRVLLNKSSADNKQLYTR